MNTNSRYKCPNCGKEGKCYVSYEYTDDFNERYGESLEYYTCKCCGHRTRSYNFKTSKSK